VLVNPLPTATIDEDVTVCQGDASPVITFTGTNGSSEYKFTYNLNGGPSQTITTNGSNTATITVPTDVFGTFTYTLEAVEDVSTGCGQPQTGTATVIVNEMPIAEISGGVTVCQYDTDPAVTFTGVSGVGTFSFEYSVNGGPTETISTSGSSSSTVTQSTAVAGTFVYELLNVSYPSSGCNQDINESITVIVNPLPDASIAGTITVCQEDTSPVITLTGTNSSGEYAFTYSLNGGASTTLTTSGSNESTITVPTDVAGTFEYELLSVEDPATGCGQPVNETVTVIVNPLPTATISQDVTVCQGDPSQTITFTGTNGSSEYKFTYNLNGGPSQTITTNGSNTATITVPTDVFGTFTYTLEAVEDVSTGCGQPQTGTATVIVNEMPIAEISGGVTVCQYDTDPVVTFTGVSGVGTFSFEYSVNGGPTETISTSGSSSSTVTQSTAVAGTFVYELLNVSYPSSGCNQDINESITVIVNPLPDASIAGTITVCQEDTSPVITLTGTNSSGEYAFTYSLNGGASTTLTTSGSNESTITVPTDVAGTFEYELLSVEDPATGCSQPVNETVTVTVNPLPDASIAGTITVCQEDASPVITLTGTNSSGEYAFTYSLNGGASTTLTTSGSRSEERRVGKECRGRL